LSCLSANISVSSAEIADLLNLFIAIGNSPGTKLDAWHSEASTTF
jgi:hypothetical protein